MGLALLQIGQVGLDGGTGIASGQPPEVPQHALGSLMFEPMQHAFQPTSWQPASLGLHGLPDLVDVFGSMRKIQDAHGIRAVVVDESLQPLGAILHGAHLCRLVHPAPLRFDQGCFRKARSLCQPRKSGQMLRDDLAALSARDLPNAERLDFHPLASYQVDKRAICTQRLLIRPIRHWGHVSLEMLLLRRAFSQRRRSCLQRRAARRRLAHLHPHQVLEQLPRLLKRHPTGQADQRFFPTGRYPCPAQS